MYRFIIAFRFLVIVTVVFSLSGCLTLGTVEIEIIQPAKITVPSNINSILIVNNSIGYPADTFKNNTQKGLFKLDTTTTQLLARQVNNILNESPRFDTSKLVDDICFRKPKTLLQPIEWEGIDGLCHSYDVNSVLSLEAFGIDDVIIKGSYYDGYAYRSYSSLSLIVNSMWRIYLNDENRVLEKRIQRDTIYIDEINSKKGYLKALSQISAINYLANKIASNISTQVSDRLAPYWQPIHRYFYIYTDVKMQQAAKLAYADNWRGAAYIWNPLTKNKNKKISAAACHNMALVCEVEGKFDVAVKWLEKAISINNTEISSIYLQQIHLRIEESVVLDKQFGVDN